MGFNDHLGEYGGFDTLETSVCADCVIDSYLVSIVINSGKQGACSYCNNNCAIADFDKIIEIVYAAIRTEYTDAQDASVPWDGGWVAPEAELWDVIGDFDPGWNESLLDDIAKCIGYDKYWVHTSQGEWLLSNPKEALNYGWLSFKETVTHKTRYFFQSEEVDPEEMGRPDYIPVSYYLSALGDIVTSHNLVKIINAGTYFYRVRPSKRNEKFTDFEHLSVPNPKKTLVRSGRMNPAGIPYFYVALDVLTAEKEVLNRKKTKYGTAKLASKHDLRVIDLVNLPETPSPFEYKEYHVRYELQFLKEFRDEISKKVVKDGREHIDYVPTQIISEFFRHRYTFEEKHLDGIIYPSSKTPQGLNIAFFFSSHEEVAKAFQCHAVSMKTFNY